MFRIIVFILIFFSFLLCGCNLYPSDLLSESSASAVNPEITANEQRPAQTEGPLWTDEINVMSGICFESAFDAAGVVFVIHNNNELSTFFNLADNSHLCRHKVERQPFDFSNGRILAGLWSYGHGCKAHHDITSIDRNDSAKKLTLHVQFVTEGDCNYELVRPFWLGLNGVSDYEIKFEITQDN